MDASGPGDVIVIANEGRVDCAGWGGLLSLAASLRGVEGVIIDGACRDVPEAVELELAVFGRAPVAVTARGRVVENAWNQPVQIPGTTVRPGDLVIADASGVAFVPQAAQDEVLAAAEQIAAREVAMAQALTQGAPISEVMGADYESLLSRGCHERASAQLAALTTPGVSDALDKCGIPGQCEGIMPLDRSFRLARTCVDSPLRDGRR